MCDDYTSLNKARPKDPFPLPRIDQVVDSTSRCDALSFLDAYSGNHQIAMKESNQLATSFISPFGLYCYVTMPFRLCVDLDPILIMLWSIVVALLVLIIMCIECPLPRELYDD